MASLRQLAANRRNGSKDGPETHAGKQRSRLNRVTHGLTSTTLVVLPDEHEHEYEEVLRGFRESFKPHDAAEDALVLRLAQAHWRSLRSRRIETGILAVTAATTRAKARTLIEDCPEHLNPHNAIAVGFMTMPAEHWQMYLRYDTIISRDFFRTLDALAKLQRVRQLSKPAPPPVPEPPPAPVRVAGAGPSGYGIRFVLQNRAAASDLSQQQELAGGTGAKETGMRRQNCAGSEPPAELATKMVLRGAENPLAVDAGRRE
jgi:hypothetical protein